MKSRLKASLKARLKKNAFTVPVVALGIGAVIWAYWPVFAR